MRWCTAPALAIIVIAAALAGCGGGEETTTEPGATARSGAAGQNAETEASAKLKKLRERIKRALRNPKMRRALKQRRGGSGGEDPGGTPPPEPSGPAPTPDAPLPNEGTRRVAPGVPTEKGGDNSIQEFGVEGPSEERVQAATTLQSYLDARVAHEWARACFYLAATIKRGLEQFGSHASQGQDSKKLDCAQNLKTFTARVSQSALRSAAEIRVLSMRIEDKQAFLIYRNGKGRPTAIPMAREGRVWKLAAIDGAPLILSADSR